MSFQFPDIGNHQVLQVPAQPLPENHGKRQSDHQSQGFNFEFDVENPPTHLVPTIPVEPYTLYILCGPTGCGKSTFARDLISLYEEVSDECIGDAYISSDQCREEILNSSSTLGAVSHFEQKSIVHSPAYLAVSKQAFELLFTKLKVVTAFPVSAGVVIVDTTGMDEKFRQDVAAVGRASGYKVTLVTFEYKTRAEYQYGVEPEMLEATEASVRRFNQKILPTIRQRDFDARIRVKSKAGFGWASKSRDSIYDLWDDWVEATQSKVPEAKGLDPMGTFLSCNYPSHEDATFAVIGDSHECVEELESLIAQIQDKHPSAQIIHVGDYLDKGGDTEKMVNFMHARHVCGDWIVQANHEAFLARRLLGEIDPNPEAEAEHFKALEVLQADSALAAKFLELWGASKPFLVLTDYINYGHLPVYVTHAPCSTKDLGKVSHDALRNQRNYRVRNRGRDADSPMSKELDWFYKEAESIHPLHIFGHITHKVTARFGQKFKNKVFLDSGAVYGGGLTAVIVQGGRVQEFLTVPSRDRIGAGMDGIAENLGLGVKEVRPFRIYDYDLEPKDLRLLDQVMSKSVKFISGTMSPSASINPSEGFPLGKIEPLKTAFDLYQKAGVVQVIVEPKYMGSRCQLYLFHSEPEKVFAVSRGGWVIRGIEGLTQEEYQALLLAQAEKYRYLTQAYGNVILDGELLPWHALGKGLIEGSFLPYQELVKAELGSLAQDLGLQQLSAFRESLGIAGKQDHLKEFEKVLARYSGNTPPEYKAFTMLSNSAEPPVSLNEYQAWQLLNPDMCRIVTLADYDLEVEEAFFNILTEDEGLEGVVVKPILPADATEKAVPPYIKVRSEQYLRLVYGYDYLDPAKYTKLVRQKSVNGKVRISKEEYALGKAMLTSEGDAKKELIVKMIGQMKQEQGLDPRL